MPRLHKYVCVFLSCARESSCKSFSYKFFCIFLDAQSINWLTEVSTYCKCEHENCMLFSKNLEPNTVTFVRLCCRYLPLQLNILTYLLNVGNNVEPANSVCWYVSTPAFHYKNNCLLLFFFFVFQFL